MSIFAPCDAVNQVDGGDRRFAGEPCLGLAGVTVDGGMQVDLSDALEAKNVSTAMRLPRAGVDLALAELGRSAPPA